MKCSYGVGKNKENDELCVKEATKNFSEPKMIVFFSGEDKFCEYARIIHSLFPNSVSIGCSAYRLWGNEGSEKDVLSVMAIEDGIEVYADVIPKADEFALSYADRVRNCLEKFNDEIENTVCVEFTVPYKNFEEYALVALNSVLLRQGIPVVGGSAANDNTSEKTFVVLNGGIYTDGCVFALIKNLGGAVRLYRENIYVPLTGRKYVTTKANSVSRTVMRLGNKTAAEVYARELGVPISEIRNYFPLYPLGRCVGEETYVTAIYEAGANGSLKNFARIHEGTETSVMTVGDYRKITGETLAKIKSETPNPSLVILFNCLARTVLFEQENAVEDYQQKLAEELPNFIGFSCCGEQMGTKHFNHTAIYAVFE